MTTTTTTMTSEQVTEIKNYAEVLTKAIEADWLNPNGSAHSTDYWMRCAVEQARAIPKLVAELERLREDNAKLRDERDRTYSALSDYGRSAVDISGDLEDGINAEHLMASAESGGAR